MYLSYHQMEPSKKKTLYETKCCSMFTLVPDSIPSMKHTHSLKQNKTKKKVVIFTPYKKIALCHI